MTCRLRGRRLCRIGVLSIGALLCSSPVPAQSAFGGAYTALPGFYRVPIAELTSERISAAVSVAAGVTEPQAGETGTHQRFSTSAALGVSPFWWLQSVLRVDARYDRHPRDGQGDNSGTVVTPTLALRWIEPLGSTLALGAEAGVWFPGTESASMTLAAASPHVALLCTWRAGPVALSMLAGYRFDRSAAASPDLEQIRFGDRLALGLSDFDAGLVALGAGYALGKTRLFVEANADVLLGTGAPAFLQSPLTASAGARYTVSDWWSVELIGITSLSERPSLAAGDPLIPVEPRFTALAGTRFRLPPTLPSPSLPENPRHGAPIRAPAPKLASLELHVQLDPNKPATAAATLSRQGKDYPMVSRGENQFVLSGLVAGSAVLRISADGYLESTETIEIPEAAVHHLDRQLQVALQAQIRGLVRSLSGRSLLARVVVEPLALHASTDADGFFQLDVPPGNYSVVIEADGYRPQRRDVIVEKDGVVILNADLSREP